MSREGQVLGYLDVELAFIIDKVHQLVARVDEPGPDGHRKVRLAKHLVISDRDLVTELTAALLGLTKTNEELRTTLTEAMRINREMKAQLEAWLPD